MVSTGGMKISTDDIGENNSAILAIGGGNVEYLYRADEIKIGQKNLVSDLEEMIGGGAVNFTARLIATGHEVFPIIPLGNDHAGKKVRDTLIKMVREVIPSRKRLLEFMDSEAFFVPTMKTSSATIIVQKSGRTTLSYLPQGNDDELKDFIEKRIGDVLIAIGGYPSAIRLSHITRFKNSGNLDAPSLMTKMVIEKFKRRSIIMTNLGSSQLVLGANYWEQSLRDVDIVQLNLHEAKQFFSISNPTENPTLSTIIRWFQERRITAIITLAKFGAIGTYKAGKDGIVFAWPIMINNFVDPTGAGDAYSAGIIATIYNRQKFSFSDFYDAVSAGRYWAAYACTTIGGCGECPTLEKLEKFKTEIGDHDPTEVIADDNIKRAIKLIDKAYS